MTALHHEAHRTGNGHDGASGRASLASFLGWFSIGLGASQVAAPRAMARLVGMADDELSERAMRTFGLREIACGVGVLMQDRPAGWLWARVAGDAMDLAALAGASRASGAQPERLAAAGAAVLGVMALDVLCARQESDAADGRAGGWAGHGTVHAAASVTVNRPREEVYAFWRDLKNLSRFMSHLVAVEPTGDDRSRWCAEGPLGMRVEWEAEVTEDRPNERIAWRSLPGADVDSHGEVRFAPATGGRGTVVRVALSYEPPGGMIGAAVARLFGREPGQEIRDDLRVLKQILETGEVTMSEAMTGRIRHPARPAGHLPPPQPVRGL
ncbi:SRPBCC family protein [Azospirillum sp. ST 5-10]|uniref:SRPBCC family protein n=1 Tax=unclassified Azospirillum TaxID=2630922 RepID=UPI003F49F33D